MPFAADWGYGFRIAGAAARRILLPRPRPGFRLMVLAVSSACRYSWTHTVVKDAPSGPSGDAVCLRTPLDGLAWSTCPRSNGRWRGCRRARRCRSRRSGRIARLRSWAGRTRRRPRSQGLPGREVLDDDAELLRRGFVGDGGVDPIARFGQASFAAGPACLWSRAAGADVLPGNGFTDPGVKVSRPVSTACLWNQDIVPSRLSIDQRPMVGTPASQRFPSVSARASAPRAPDGLGCRICPRRPRVR